jgi:hypothetical protein
MRASDSGRPSLTFGHDPEREFGRTPSLPDQQPSSDGGADTSRESSSRGRSGAIGPVGRRAWSRTAVKRSELPQRAPPADLKRPDQWGPLATHKGGRRKRRASPRALGRHSSGALRGALKRESDHRRDARFPRVAGPQSDRCEGPRQDEGRSRAAAARPADAGLASGVQLIRRHCREGRLGRRTGRRDSEVSLPAWGS